MAVSTVSIVSLDPGAHEVGADLLDEVRGQLLRYVVLPNRQSADAVVLWIVASHAQTAWECAPRLVIKSPEKRCGKSRLLDLVNALAANPLVAFNATVAAIVRSIGDKSPPTILLDEADAIWSKNKTGDGAEDLRALLNAGFGRGRPVIRCVLQIPTEFPSFAMAALAGIGSAVPDTITDRSIVIKMRRRSMNETVAPYRERRDGLPLTTLRERVSVWVGSIVDELRVAEPAMPVEDRAADVWEPLVAIADAAGGGWPQAARTACLALTSEAEAEDAEASLSRLLLTDLQRIFSTNERLHSVEVVTLLGNMEERPWGDFYGRRFNERDLTKYLSPTT